MNNTVFVMSFCFPNSRNPQLGRFVLEQCVELRNRGLSIVVLNVARAKKLGKKKITVREEEGFPVYETTVFPLAQSKFPRLTTALYLKKYRRLLRRAMQDHGTPKKLYAHFSCPTGFVAGRLSGETGIPFVVMEHHSLYFRKKLPAYILRELKKTVEKSDDFLCVSAALKEAVVGKTGCAPDKVRVVHNVVEQRFQYTEPAQNPVFTFFSAGNLVPGKRFSLLLDAAARLYDRGVSFRLRIAGAGEEKSELQSKIEEYHLSDTVCLLGRVDKEQMLKEYQMSDAFVLPSKVETYGIVYRESLLVGRPVISSDNGGIREDWDDRFGIILEQTTVDTLADAMERLIEQYNTYDLKQIAEKARETCSAEHVCEQILRSFE